MKKNKLAILYLLLLTVVLSVTGFTLKLIYTELLVKEIIKSGINYDAFRELRLSEDALRAAGRYIMSYNKKFPKLKDCDYIDQTGYITFSMLARNYDLSDNKPVDLKTFQRGISKIADNQSFRELYHYYEAILSDIQYFPVPYDMTGKSDITYVDTWHVLRRYGGNRRHEGTDLMDSNNRRGYYPIISITDGIVEKMGWLEQGGYRIGIRADSGGYFYYAHLHTYAPHIMIGDRVIAGQVLGFMGDSGYGSEGTTGNFDVHLHLGIYVKTNLGEMSVNPFWLLKILEGNRTTFSNQ